MPAMMCKFQVIDQASVTNHDTVKSLMILERADDLESEPVPVESDDFLYVIGRSSHT
jgi:predicted methyltransferase